MINTFPVSSSSKWPKVVGLGAACAVIVALGFGAFIETGLVPSSNVVLGRDLPQNHLAHLVNSRIVKSDEDVVLFYSAGTVSIAEDGNVLTNERVITYETFNGKTVKHEAAFVDIEDIVILEAGNDYLNTTIEIQTIDGGSFQLSCATLQGGDTRFIKELKERALDKPFDTMARRTPNL